MQHSRFILFVFIFAAIAQAVAKTNVIIIFPDDQGTTDLGIYGVDKLVQTPTLDRVAAGGALMYAGYSSSPKCVPSRAGLMTGRIQNEIGVVTNDDDPLPLRLPSGEPLKIAPQYMKELGYRTGQIGKWSLGERDAYFVGERGFDDYYSGANLKYIVNFDLAGNPVERYVGRTRSQSYRGTGGSGGGLY